jgi:hypothetical protein
MAVKYMHIMVLYMQGKQVKSQQVNMEWRMYSTQMAAFRKIDEKDEFECQRFFIHKWRVEGTYIDVSL